MNSQNIFDTKDGFKFSRMETPSPNMAMRFDITSHKSNEDTLPKRSKQISIEKVKVAASIIREHKIKEKKMQVH